MTKELSFELGWGARKFKEQCPELSDDVATHFDKDNEALCRLRMRGYLTDGAKDAAVKKVGKALSAALAKARGEAQ